MSMMARALCAIALAGGLALGCVPGDSMIEKGQKVETGQHRFDAYFREVSDLRDKVKGMDADLFPIRQPLTEDFNLGSDTPLPKIMAETRKRTEKLKGFGVLLALKITPSPTIVLVQGELAADEADETAVKAMQEAAVRALATYKQYNELIGAAQKLDDERSQLAETTDKLPPEIDKGQIETELVGAGKVLKDVNETVGKRAHAAAYFLLALAEAVDTGGAELREQACDQAMAHYKPPKPSFRGRGRGGRGGPRAPSAAGAPPPPPPPAKKGGDFEM